MKIITLIENSSGIEGCSFEHGLSFYIETEQHKLLMDTGASDAIIRNAEILGIDLKSVDPVFLSHGHYDHPAALQHFLKSMRLLKFTCSARRILISGCAHNGILDILDEYHRLYDTFPHMVISGLHMMKNSEYTPEEIDIIKCTARELAAMDTVFYTGHCTSEKAYDIMKEIMGEQLHALHTGLRIL